MRAPIALTLEDEGYRVMSAPNGEEALAVAETVDVDGVVLDLQMPVMDGRTFFRKFRDGGRRDSGRHPLSTRGTRRAA